MAEKYLILLCLVVTSSGLPQGYGSGNIGTTEEPECITRQKNINEIVTNEEFRSVCNPIVEQVCESLTRKDCKEVDEQECFQGVKDECKTDYKDSCVDDFRLVPESYTEDECIEEVVTVCEQAWIQEGLNEKVWADDPSTCQDLTKTNCQPVSKSRNVREKYTKCDKVPFQTCQQVPDTKCAIVKKEKCEDVPFQDCKFVNRSECKEKHVQVPHQVTRQISIRVCKNEFGQFPTEEEDAEILIKPRNENLKIKADVQDDNQISNDPERIVFP